MGLRVTCAIYKFKILDNLLDISKPQTFHLWKGDNNSFLMVDHKITWHKLFKTDIDVSIKEY